MFSKFFKSVTNFSLIFLSKRILAKFKKSYKAHANKALPIILVAGNVGKSSQTLILNQLFEYLGYKVWTGTTQNKNRNTLTGLVMTLGEMSVSLEKASIWQKIGFIFKAKLIWFFKSWNFGQKPNILIFEVGVDHQEEMDDYISVFGEADWVILSNFGPEHTAGFSQKFDSNQGLISNYGLNELFKNVHDLDLKSIEIDDLLKNCYFEQLKLLSIAKNYILPTSFDLDRNEIVLKTAQGFEIVKPLVARNSHILEVDGILTPDYFLFPLSFSRQISMAQKVSQGFELSKSAFMEVMANLVLPNGRFGFFDGVNQTKIVDSSYNSDPASLNSFLDLVVEMDYKGMNYVVLGEMRELGEVAVEVHNEILERLESISQNLKIEVFLLGSTWLKCRYNRSKFKHFKKVGSIVSYFKEIQPEKDAWVWIKGSQNTIFLEVLVEFLIQKPIDKSRLARQGQDWDEMRKNYLE